MCVYIYYIYLHTQTTPFILDPWAGVCMCVSLCVCVHTHTTKLVLDAWTGVECMSLSLSLSLSQYTHTIQLVLDPQTICMYGLPSDMHVCELSETKYLKHVYLYTEIVYLYTEMAHVCMCVYRHGPCVYVCIRDGPCMNSIHEA